MSYSAQAQQSLHVEHITKRFYERFKNERSRFLTTITGLHTDEDREKYTSLMLNRLMFLYFMQWKGFLNHDQYYLSQRLQQTQERLGMDHFYRSFLLPLFHQGLGTSYHPPHILALLGDIPYLGGALFAVDPLEQMLSPIQIPDHAFASLFTLFSEYQWQIEEQFLNLPNQITPHILGYIFEKYINQQQMGAYYTREDITSYIAKNTIIPALFTSLEQESPSTFSAHGTIRQLLRQNPERYIYEAVYHPDPLPGENQREYQDRCLYSEHLRHTLLSPQPITIDDCITYNIDIYKLMYDGIESLEEPELLFSVYMHLKQLTILDPCCGSGAFLFAALQVLKPLYNICLTRLQTFERNRVGEELWQELHSFTNQDYFVTKTIITNNLYGVDIMEEAVEICKLHLLLQLIDQLTQSTEIEPLPDINHNIYAGNALIGFVSSSSIHKNYSQQTLDDILAPFYGITPDDEAAYIRWKQSHRPFHWQLAFPRILMNGGFDVIISNPPYVEYSRKNFPYTLENFVTLSCANLYPCVIERSHHLLSQRGRTGMILPLAAFSTRNMIPFINNFLNWFPTTWLSFYHFRPAMLFSGGKVASIPTAIYLAATQGAQQRFSTRLQKWSAAQRPLLFSLLTYCHITIPRDPANSHYYPKFGASLENSIMQKLLSHQTVTSYLSRTSGPNTMYYRSAGGLYWKVFINFPWPYITSSNKRCTFLPDYDRDVFVALFNSSLFWWYYTTTFDTFNLKDYLLFGFHFSYPTDQDLIKALQYQCERLMHSYRQHAQHRKRVKSDSYTVFAKKSKSIIDDIDRLLAQHYGFTTEELDFIINYDLKYRLGKQHPEPD